MIPHIAIVDDDPKFARTICGVLQSLGKISVFEDEASFYSSFRSGTFDVLLLDLRLKTGKEGLEILKWVVHEDPGLPVVIVTSYGDIPTSVDALKLGACDFLEKSDGLLESLPHVIEKLLNENAYKRTLHNLQRDLRRLHPLDLIGESTAMRQTRDRIQKVSEDAHATVLVTGETGTGKELVARAIHRLGSRKHNPFVSLSLAGIPRDLLASQLFGHERGAFTGADSRHVGLLEEAHKGVLFLDEIGELPEEVQVQLLRVLEERAFRRLGGTRDISVDVQLISATHQDLDDLVTRGSFRRALYYRLVVFTIELAPLRDRREDIPLLLEYFLDSLVTDGRTKIRSVSPSALRHLADYSWPGNVRELKNTIEGAIIHAGESRTMHSKHLPDNVRRTHVDVANTHKLPSSIQLYLAEKEFELLSNAIQKWGMHQELIASNLKYANRFALRRRVLGILSEFPHLAQQYPEASRLVRPRSRRVSKGAVDNESTQTSHRG